jgi:hypothetical protein
VRGKGGSELFERFREEVVSLGIRRRPFCATLVPAATRMGRSSSCSPDDVWYTHVTLEDVREIVDKHLGRQTRVKN